MNEAHFHLVVNHLPIILPIAGLIVLGGGIFLKNEVVKRMAYFLFIIGSVTAFVSMASGEGAEEVAEKIAGVTKHVIHEHEEKAEVFAVLSYLLGAFSLVALWSSWKDKSFKSIISWIVFAFTLVVLFLGKQTGTTGGEIRHTEIRSGQPSVDLQSDDHDDHD